MATIQKRGPFQWRAQIRRKGWPLQSETFETRKAAEDWATDIESQMRRGTFVDRGEIERTTFGEVLARYQREVSPHHKGWRQEVSRLTRMQTLPLAQLTLARLRSADFAQYRDARGQAVAPATVKQELLLFSAVLNTCRLDWSLPVENFIQALRKPAVNNQRNRRLGGEEEMRLLSTIDEMGLPHLRLAVVLALETGMRRGEIAPLTWQHVNFADKTILLQDTKNSEARIVPLTGPAEAALRAYPRRLHSAQILGCRANALTGGMARASKRAQIVDLRFHDLRHEAASRFAKKMTVQTLAKVMGWKTLQMAMRYYNPTSEDLVAAVRAA